MPRDRRYRIGQVGIWTTFLKRTRGGSTCRDNVVKFTKDDKTLVIEYHACSSMIAREIHWLPLVPFRVFVYHITLGLYHATG